MNAAWKLGTVILGALSLLLVRNPTEGAWAAVMVAIVFFAPWLTRPWCENPAVWVNLFWKEWREHQWKLAALTAIALALPLWSLAPNSIGIRSYTAPLEIMTVIVLPASACFIGIGLAAGERSRSTLSMIQQMPASMTGIATTKLIVGVLVVWLPQVLAICFTWGVLELGDRFGWPGIASSASDLEAVVYFLGPWWVDRLLLSLVLAFSLVLWFAAPGVNSTDEVRAAGIALVVSAVLWAVWGANVSWALQSDPSAFDTPANFLPYALSVAGLPGGLALLMANENRDPLVGAVIAAFIVVHAALACWYLLRFGRLASPSRRAQEKATADQPRGWLGSPGRSPLIAMLWKHWRQAAPVMAAAFAGALLIGLVMFLSALQDVSRLFPSWAEMAMATTALLTGFGALAGLVVGVGLTTTDLTTGLHTFWRSRPISPDLWFWSLFASGLAMLLIAFVLPLSIAGAVVSAFDPDARSVTVWCAAAVLLNYAFGVLAGCLTRHAVYGCLLGLGAFIASYVLGIIAANDADPSRLTMLVGVQFVLVGVIAVLTWQLVRIDRRLGT